MAESYQTFDLIEEITRNDGSRYFEVANTMMNGVAEAAAIKGLIKSVRILQLNIPRSKSLVTYEQYVNETYEFPGLKLTSWEEWEKPAGIVADAFNMILRTNHIG